MILESSLGLARSELSRLLGLILLAIVIFVAFISTLGTFSMGAYILRMSCFATIEADNERAIVAAVSLITEPTLAVSFIHC